MESAIWSELITNTPLSRKSIDCSTFSAKVFGPRRTTGSMCAECLGECKKLLNYSEQQLDKKFRGLVFRVRASLMDFDLLAMFLLLRSKCKF